MTVIDLITRVDAICKKYDKYDVVKENDLNGAGGDDAFARLYGVVEADFEAALQKSESAAAEKNRATVIAINAEIRRTKARLFEEIPKLQRLAFKKVKGLSREEQEARSDLVSALKDRIEAIPDGSAGPVKKTSDWAPSTSHAGIKIDSSYDGKFDNEYFQPSEESDRFRQDYETRRVKQDQGLDVIAEGLDTLKNMAHDMNEEMDRQEPLVDEIDDKVDKATSDLKSTNVRLKDTVNQLSSSYSTQGTTKKNKVGKDDRVCVSNRRRIVESTDSDKSTVSKEEFKTERPVVEDMSTLEERRREMETMLEIIIRSPHFTDLLKEQVSQARASASANPSPPPDLHSELRKEEPEPRLAGIYKDYMPIGVANAMRNMNFIPGLGLGKNQQGRPYFDIDVGQSHKNDLG